MQVSQHRKDELARRKRMGIARVERPLRFIAAKTNQVGTDGRGNTVVTKSYAFKEAAYCHSRGQGHYVQRIAMGVANA